MNLKQADKELFEISKQIKLVSYSNPTNIEKEKERFFSSNRYNPIFAYKPFDVANLERKLKSIKIKSKGKIAELLVGVKEQLTKQINCVKNRATEQYTNTELHGVPSNKLIMKAYDILQNPRKDP